MQLGLSEEEGALRARAGAFARAVVAPGAGAINRGEAHPWDVGRASAGAGFMGMTVPRDLDGQCRSLLEAVPVVEGAAPSAAQGAR